ncbi:MAG: multiheme c-type cytochrome [Pseudomonadota bacterium]
MRLGNLFAACEDVRLFAARVASAVLLAGIWIGVGTGAAPASAQEQPKIYSGVTTCANSQCHGAATVNPNSRVNRNEFSVWLDQDPHSQSYRSLETDRASRIAANLGLGEATKAEICLSCHANNVPEEQRGPDFDISEGVTCEVCHGSSVEWLGPHRLPQNYNHSDLVALGLYPTNDPVARADMCLDCHFGADDNFLSHRIYGAGHPRVTFELDSYTWINAHHSADQDYYERKPVSDGVVTWAIGAAKMIERRMELLADERTGTAGFFPEFAFFDCNTCHHRMSDLRFQRREIGTQPGTPKLDDSHMAVLKVALRRADPALADQMRRGMIGLHNSASVSRGALVAQVNQMRDLARQAADAVAAVRLTGDDMRRILDDLTRSSVDGQLSDYAQAEQAALVAGATIDALEVGWHITTAEADAMFAELNKAYDAVQNDEKFEPRRFAAAMRSLGAVIR